MTPEEALAARQAARATEAYDAEVKAARDLMRLCRDGWPDDFVWPPHTTEVGRQLAYMRTAADRLIRATAAEPIIKARFKDAEMDGGATLATVLAEAAGLVLRGIPEQIRGSALTHVTQALYGAAGAMAIVDVKTTGPTTETRQ
jgi:hypothetical protein